MFMMDQLAHLSLIGSIASDHGDQMAKRYAVTEVRES